MGLEDDPTAAMTAPTFRLEIQTRWMDTDAYGHVHNAEFYSYFDTAIAVWLAEEGGAPPGRDPSIGICVESKCSFLAPIYFLDVVVASVTISSLGGSSVRYEIGLDVAGTRVGEGYFVHVFVDRETRRPTPIPAPLRGRMAELLVAED